MKGIAKVEIEIPIEYDELSKERILNDLAKHFNAKYNKSSMISCSTEKGTYSWKLPKKDARVELINQIEI